MGSYIIEYYKMELYTLEDLKLFLHVDMITEEDLDTLVKDGVITEEEKQIVIAK